MINKLWLTISIAVTVILSVGLVYMKTVKVFASATNIPSTLLERVKKLKQLLGLVKTTLCLKASMFQMDIVIMGIHF